MIITTKRQALAAARGRWGASAYVEHRPEAPDHSAAGFKAGAKHAREARKTGTRMNKAGIPLRLLLAWTNGPAEDRPSIAEQMLDAMLRAGDTKAARDALLMTAKWTRQNLRRAIYRTLERRDSQLLEAQAAHPAFENPATAFIYRRCNIGYTGPLGGFHIKGAGDTWAQAASRAGLQPEEKSEKIAG